MLAAGRDLADLFKAVYWVLENLQRFGKLCQMYIWFNVGQILCRQSEVWPNFGTKSENTSKFKYRKKENEKVLLIRKIS